MNFHRYPLIVICCGLLLISSCSSFDETDAESAPVPISSEAAQIKKNPESEPALMSSDESVSETNSISPESELTNASNGRVVRTSPDTLQITLLTGEKVFLKNENISEDHSNKYVYIGYDENLESYLVDLQFYEKFGVLAIDAYNGNQTRLPGPPIYNTQKDFFVCYGGEGPVQDAVIEIYSVYHSQIRNDFREEPEWTIESASWEDEETITLTASLILPGGDIVKGEAKIESWGRRGRSRSWHTTRPQYYKGRWKSEDTSDSESTPVSVASDDNQILLNTDTDPASISAYEPFYEGNLVVPDTDLINASDGRVLRTSPDILQINLENGEKFIFQDYDEVTDHANVTIHAYRGFDEIIGCHLIELMLHEEVGVLAVNAKDGTIQRLIGLPIYNSSQNMFFTIVGDNIFLDPVVKVY